MNGIHTSLCSCCTADLCCLPVSVVSHPTAAYWIARELKLTARRSLTFCALQVRKHCASMANSHGQKTPQQHLWTSRCQLQLGALWPLLALQVRCWSSFPGVAIKIKLPELARQVQLVQFPELVLHLLRPAVVMVHTFLQFNLAGHPDHVCSF